MEIENYTFNAFNDYTSNGISCAIAKFNAKELAPIIICIGSDLVLGDSLGPLVGTLLKKKGVGVYVYGTLNYPITAKEIENVQKHLKHMHPNSILVAVDAAVGLKDDVGNIRVVNKGLKPGTGVNKNLGEIGDVSIIGVVAGKSKENYDLFNLTRLGLIYKMAEKISNGIEDYIKNTFPCADKKIM